jgi:hypothetical protein
MSDTFRFVVQEGLHTEAEAVYLPYGTRTLRLEVINQAGRPLKLWLRPETTPEGYPQHVVHGYADDDPELWVHWAGGEESGATVKMKDVLYKAVPAEVADDGSPHPVFLNLTHPAGDIRRRSVTLRAYTGEKAAEEPLDSTLTMNLAVPTGTGMPVERPAQGLWNEDKTLLHFAGDTLPDYVSRWWASGTVNYRPAGDLPGQLSLDRKDNSLTLTLEADNGGLRLVEILDNGWRPGQDSLGQRHVLGELFHFLEDRYYVVRLWFLWLDKRIGPAHEVPDAERVDVLFDVETGRVVFLGTDFHYREIWTYLKSEEPSPRVTLSVHRRNLDDLLRLLLLSLAGGKKSKDDPAREVRRRLQEEGLPVMVPMQKGPITGTPLLDLKGLVLPDTTISEDVRKG